jgi:hypothetical protein
VRTIRNVRRGFESERYVVKSLRIDREGKAEAAVVSRLEASSGSETFSSSRFRRRRRCGRASAVAGGSIGPIGCSTLVLRWDVASFVADVVVLSIVAVDCWRAIFAHEPFPDDPKSSFNAPLGQKYCPSPIVRRGPTPTTAVCFLLADVCRYRICSRWSFCRQRRHTDRVSRDFRA